MLTTLTHSERDKVSASAVDGKRALVSLLLTLRASEPYKGDIIHFCAHVTELIASHA
jgi:hypothetical protein